ncbi:hypothetical protein Pmani_032058, partial [Petrolisthes manimaculis]
TGTVVVRLADVNDNSPRLTRNLWRLDVEETWGDDAPSNTTLLEISTTDHDTSNYFFYRVVEGSGWGWEHFGVRTEGRVGQVYAKKTLDFEDPAQRRGFRFMVQVTDRGRGGWSDARHTDTGWVEVKLRDVNDNPPTFPRPHTHITVTEDTSPGSLLVTLLAHDADMVGEQGVDYHVVGGWGALRVEGGGAVRLWRTLDREAEGGEVGVARIIAIDSGRPPLSSTATLTITVSDVNDCPPHLRPPTLLHVTEGASPTLLGMLTATDDDLWQLGHGPPFSFTLAPSNPSFVTQTISLQYHHGLDSGRGGAEVWTTRGVDREEHRQLTVEVVVGDAGGLAATHPITVIIDDINDNPMKPATKTVHLWKTQGGGAEVDLGRVYVDDPDDWDLDDKTFQWAGPPHPHFSLHSHTGHIFASTQLRERRYELQFLVSDRVWKQEGVSANVTVEVRYLSPETLSHSVPITLSPTTPTAIATNWTPDGGGGGLGTLTEAVRKVVGRTGDKIEVVSVYGIPSPSSSHTHSNFPNPAPDSSSDPSTSTPLFPHTQPSPGELSTPHTCVWVSVKQADGKFLDPIKLHGLLSLSIYKLENAMNLRVAVDDSQLHQSYDASGGRGDGPHSASFPSTSPSSPHRPSSVASLASVILPLQVVDTNVTSLVTPRLTRAHNCNPHTRYDPTCTSNSCLNGGRCVRTDVGSRCVCPGGSWGPQCKILSRTFLGSGFAWVRSLPPCLPTTISIRLLPRTQEGIVLYSGPFSAVPARPSFPPTPLLALQVMEGRAQVVLEGAGGPLHLQVNSSLTLNTWHTLHLHLSSQGVTLMVDVCGRGWEGGGLDNAAHCIARAAWLGPDPPEQWRGSGPVQLGGLAHPLPHSADHGWTTKLTDTPLRGCLSHFTVNGQLVDLGEPPYSSGSEAGCSPQDIACGGSRLRCGVHGWCVGGLLVPHCECHPGFMGPNCATPTIPVSLGRDSFAKVTLVRSPDPYDLWVQLRVRSRGQPTGLLVQLASSDQFPALRLHLRGGVVCSSLSGEDSGVMDVCLDSFPLADGLWHTLYLSRHGHNLAISADDGDGWRRNESLPSLLVVASHGDLYPKVTETPLRLEVDSKDGVMVGGVAEFVRLSLVAVQEDLKDTCIDDLRVSGVPVPLPKTVPAPTTSDQGRGQMATMQNLEPGCPSNDPCTNTTCLAPLTCHNTWRHATCRCGPGEHMMGGLCQDIDECVFSPCLYGGSCYNLRPGYQCTCPGTHTGENCEWPTLPSISHPLTAPLAVAALTLSILVVVIIGVVLTLRLHRWRLARGTTELSTVTDVLETPLTIQAVTDISHAHTVTKHILTPPGMPPGVKAGGVGECVPEVSLTLPITTTIHMPGGGRVVTKPDHSSKQQRPQHCSSISVSLSAKDLGPQHHDKQQQQQQKSCGGVKQMVCCIEGRGLGVTSPVITTAASVQQMVVEGAGGKSTAGSTQPLPAQDDLRAYAYEGDSSPSGSLSSTVLGLQAESVEEDNIKPLLSEYGDVLDLLKNLPDAVHTSPSLHRNHSLSPPTTNASTSSNTTLQQHYPHQSPPNTSNQYLPSTPTVCMSPSPHHHHYHHHPHQSAPPTTTSHPPATAPPSSSPVVNPCMSRPKSSSVVGPPVNSLVSPSVSGTIGGQVEDFITWTHGIRSGFVGVKEFSGWSAAVRVEKLLTWSSTPQPSHQPGSVRVKELITGPPNNFQSKGRGSPVNNAQEEAEFDLPSSRLTSSFLHLTFALLAQT